MFTCGTYLSHKKKSIDQINKNTQELQDEHIDKSSMAKHSFIHKHMTQFNTYTTKILHPELFYYKRIVKEALTTYKNPNNFNNDISIYD